MEDTVPNQEVIAALDEIDRILHQKRRLAELSASEGDRKRDNLQKVPGKEVKRSPAKCPGCVSVTALRFSGSEAGPPAVWGASAPARRCYRRR